MVKFLITVLCVAALMQISFAADYAEVINHKVREYLNAYDKFLAEDDGTHKEDLKKLIEISEGALKLNTAEEKDTLLQSLPEKFPPAFNTYIKEKLEEYNVNDDIQDGITFYKSLLNAKAELKPDIEKVIEKLEAISKETTLQAKKDELTNLNKIISPELQKFLAENDLPKINQELQKTSEFFENLLAEDGLKFATEIKELKTQADAALGDITVEEKRAALNKVTNPSNAELYEYLQKKFIELN